MSLDNPIGVEGMPSMPQMPTDTVGMPVQQPMPVQEVAVQAPVATPVAQPAQVAQPTQVAQPVPDQVVAQPAPVAPVNEMANAQMVQQQEQVVVTEEVAPLVNEAAMQMPAMPAIPNDNINVSNTVVVDPATQASIGGIGMDQAVVSQEDVASLNTQQNTKVVPIVVDGLADVGNCPISGWGGFLKILDFFCKDLGKDDIMSILAGKMNTSKAGTFIRSDLSHYIGDITLNLTNPSQTYKKLKLLKDGELIQIFKDEVLNKYMFCSIQNDRISTKIGTKIAETDEDGSLTTIPNLGTPMYSKAIGEKEIEVIKNIIEAKNAMEDEEPYKFGFSKADNSLVSIGVGEDFAHYFQDDHIETVEFKCYYPFPINKMDGLTIKRFELPNSEGSVDTWIEIINNVDLTSIITTEKVSIVDNEIEGFSY